MPPARNVGRQIPVAGGSGRHSNEPMGVVGVITPWALKWRENRVLGPSRRRWPPAQRGAGQTRRAAPLTTMRLGELAPRRVTAARSVAGKGALVGERFVTHPTSQDRVHRVHRSRQAGAVPRLKSSSDVRLGGRAPTSSSTTAGAPRRPRRPEIFTTRWAGLLCPKSNPGAAQRLRPVYGAARAGGTLALSSGTPDHAPPRYGSLVSRAHRRSPGYVPDDAPVAFRGTAPAGARILVSTNRSHTQTRQAHCVTDESSGRWL